MPDKKPINVDRPVTFTMTPGTLDAVLRGLELLPHGLAKQAWAEIEPQIIAQFNPPAPVVPLKKGRR
jgi:hypothetical protein